MIDVTVFDWAQVKLAEEYLEYLSVIFSDNGHKQDVIHQLANIGGVSLNWDATGRARLEGSWIQILKAQTVFEQYVSSIEGCSSTAGTHEPGDQLDPHTTDRTKEATIGGGDLCGENEVYVDITLSGSFCDLPGKVSQKNKELQCSVSSKKYLISSNLNPCSSSYYNEQTIDRLTAGGEFLENKLQIDQESEQSVPSSMGVNEALCVPCCSDECLRENHASLPHVFKLHGPFSCANNKRGVIWEDESQSGRDRGTSQDKNMSHLLEINKGPDKTTTECKFPAVNPVEETSVLDLNSRKPMKLRRRFVKKKDYEELSPFKFFCSLCSFKSKRESHFQKHMKLHNEVSEIFKCGQCCFSTIRLSHLRRHELSHSSFKLTCSMCHYHTNNQKLLARHRRIKHSSSKISAPVKELLRCRHCEYETKSHHHLERHRKIHLKEFSSEIEIFQCDQCSYKTSRKEHLVRHVNNIHKGQRPFLCHTCGKAFKRQDALKMHSTTHLSQSTVFCPDCGKGCRSQVHLAQHKSVHCNERAFLCELCGASFKTRAVQRKHMHTIHQHPKSYVCSQCSRKFSTKFALRRHVIQHSMEKKSEHSEVEEPSGQSTGAANSVRILPLEAVFIHNSAELGVAEQQGTLQGTDKSTARIAEQRSQEVLDNIPPPTLLQLSSEAPALVYLSAPFPPYSLP